jgi:hypothetical protein
MDVNAKDNAHLSFYGELFMRKQNGEELRLDKLSREELKALYAEASTSDIAKLFDVSFDKVRYRLRKWKILYSDIIKERVEKTGE